MPNHRVREEWMGEDVETLEDLLRPELRAVCVGINPSPVSVAAGHYYQGRVGQRFFGRLREAGLLPGIRGYEDDTAFEAGVGFTDIIKRPTANAKVLPPAEYQHGKQRLRSKLETFQPELVIFTFKKTAQVLFGPFSGNGFRPDLRLADSGVFVMPGPYEDASTAAATIGTLAEHFDRSG
jgi:double-stranded uracil-DNA glycosylase